MELLPVKAEKPAFISPARRGNEKNRGNVTSACIESFIYIGDIKAFFTKKSTVA